MMTPAPIDTLMRALSDPTRRAVFDRIARSSEITVSELTQGSGVTQGAISQHVKLLKQAGLVVERPEGRHIYYRAQPHGLMPLSEWVRTYERFWTNRLDHLEQLLLDDDARIAATTRKTNKTRNPSTKKQGDDR